MSQDIKSLRNRIKSVNSTLHLTKAMGLVASSKVKKANEAMHNAHDYMESLQKMISMLASAKECQNSPFIQSNATESIEKGSINEIQKNNERIRIIVVAGDKGMAGGYNANIFRFMKDYDDAEVIPIGKRACDRYKGEFISSDYFSSSKAMEIAQKQCEDFLNGEYDRLCILSTKYISAMTQEPKLTQLLPIKSTEEVNLGVIFEPDELTILNEIVPDYVSGMITALVRESFACEVTARRAAMDSAGKNAQEMIDELTLSYNHARQGAITQEITEIVAGSGI